MAKKKNNCVFLHLVLYRYDICFNGHHAGKQHDSNFERFGNISQCFFVICFQGLVNMQHPMFWQLVVLRITGTRHPSGLPGTPCASQEDRCLSCGANLAPKVSFFLLPYFVFFTVIVNFLWIALIY